MDMHGGKDTAHLHTPSMFMTAEDDTWASSDPAQAYNEATELHHKVLTKQMTGGHLEPLGGHPAKLNVYAGKFLSCFLRHAATHCQAFYGPATNEIQTVCQAPNVEYKDCRVAGDSPVSGTTPAPTTRGLAQARGRTLTVRDMKPNAAMGFKSALATGRGTAIGTTFARFLAHLHS